MVADPHHRVEMSDDIDALTVGIVEGGRDEQPVGGSQCPPVNYEMVADPHHRGEMSDDIDASTVGIVEGGRDEQPVGISQCPPVNYEMVADPLQYCVAVILNTCQWPDEHGVCMPFAAAASHCTVNSPAREFQCLQSDLLLINADGTDNDISDQAVDERPNFEQLSLSVPSEESRCVDGVSAKVSVMQTSNIGHRRYDKKQFCLFCGEGLAKICRHWISQHPNEREVIEIQNAPNTEKQKLVTKLRNMGNHMHNVEVMKCGEGSLAVTYRPNCAVRSSHYVMCEYCFAYISRKQLYRHHCKFANEKRKPASRRYNSILPCPTGISVKAFKLLDTMNGGCVKLVCKTDRVILGLASKLYLRVGEDKPGDVRATARAMGRLLLALRELPGLQHCSIADCLKPEHFQNVVQSVKSLSGYDEDTNRFLKPALALKLGHTLSECIRVLKTEAIENRDHSMIENCDAFRELYENEWNSQVASQARRTLYERKRNSVQRVPFTEDVQKLNAFLRHNMVEAKQKIVSSAENQSSELPIFWRTLAESALTLLIVFNRRRQGEVSKMKVSDYRVIRKSDLSSDVEQCLSQMERKMCQLFARVELVGKRGRTVPLLLNDELQQVLKLLIDHRDAAGVNSQNEFVFARNFNSSLSHIRGTDCLRKFAEECGAKHPQNLRSTMFRKQIAISSQLLGLKDNELDVLAQFLGHDIRTHREYYRLPNETMQLAKLSKLLLMMDQGTLVEQSGKTLDEILVNMDVGK